MPRSLIALGANLGDRQRNCDRALELLAADQGLAVAARSGFYETRPIGGPSGQRAFLNAAALLDTTLSPAQLHERLQNVERQLGRQRHQSWDARTLDLDLLLYDDTQVDTPELTLPHPRMAFRRFVLEPAAEIAPQWVHPQVGWSIARLLSHLNTAPPYVALAGAQPGATTAIVQRLAAACGGRSVSQAVIGQRDDSSGRLPAPPIQFLDDIAALLRDELAGLEKLPPGSVAGQTVVSDFWFDQLLASGQVELRDQELERFEARHADLRRQLILPKLIVVLDERPAQRGGGSSSPAATALDVLAARPGQLALYAGRDPARQIEEATAALAAMR